MTQKMSKDTFKEIIVAAALLSATGAIAYFGDKADNKQKAENGTKATLLYQDHIDVLDSGSGDVVDLYLDLDGDNTTAEASVRVSDAMIDAKMLRDILPTGSVRSVWEWKQLGRYQHLK